MKPHPDRRAVDRLLALDTPSLSDALDRLGLRGVVLGLRCLAGSPRFGGRAVTVQLGPATDTPPGRHLGTAAVEAAAPGDVIVVSHGRDDVAGWGGLLALGAKQRDVAGVVVDGAVRDVDQAEALSLSLVARCAVPVTARGRVVEVAWNTPVQLDGVAVSPGDLVLSDGSGVVVVPAAHEDAVLEAADAIAAAEEHIATAIRTGRSISEAMGSRYETMLDSSRSS